jgi:hypothetical protein
MHAVSSQNRFSIRLPRHRHLRQSPCCNSFFSYLFGSPSSSEENISNKKVALKSEWWLNDKDIFGEIEGEADWRREVVDRDAIVCVDWAAVWCKGCEKAHTHIASLAGNPDLKKNLRWARVLMVEGNSFHKGLAKAQSVSKIPQLTVYEGGEQLLSFPAPQNVEAARIVAKNLSTIISHPGQQFVLDPNGFVLAKGPRVNHAAKKDIEAVSSSNTNANGECEDDCAADWS